MRNLRHFWPYIWPHRRGIAIVLLVMLAGVALEVIKPWPMKVLVDNVLGAKPASEAVSDIFAALPGGQDPRGAIAWIAVLTVIFFVMSTVLGMISTTAFVAVGQRMVYDLSADLFRHIQRQSLLFHGKHQVGDLVARVTVDTYCVQAIIAHAVFPVIQSGLTLVAVFGIMWSLDSELALLALAVVPLLALLIGGFAGAMEKAARLRSDIDAELMSKVEQTLSAVPAVQAFVREQLETDRFRARAEDAVTAHKSSVLVDLWFKLGVGLVTAGATAGLLYLGAGRVLDGHMTVGTILVFLAYLHSLYDPINTLVYSAFGLQAISANAARVLEILHHAPDVTSSPDAKPLAIQGHIRYENVRFGYETDRPVLDGITLEAHPGETIAIVGPSGAGKTTLLSLLPRFFDPWSGRITIDGHDLHDIPVDNLRHQVGLVLQEPFLFPYSIEDNIAYGRPGASRDDVIAAAKAANADSYIRKLPSGYDTIIGERGATLSGGERQRLNIARAFLKNAPILILDEPTSALDAITEGLLLDALERLCKGRTTFIIAHRLSTIRNADRILVIDGGKVFEQGRHDDLAVAGGLYSRLYQQQSGKPLLVEAEHG